MISMENRAQASVEYLLLIGGAVLIAAIVIIILVSSAGPAGQTSNALGKYNNEYNELYHTETT